MLSLSVYSSRSFSFCIVQNSDPRSVRECILRSHEIHSGFLRESVQESLVSTSSLQVSNASASRLYFTSLRMSQLKSLSNPILGEEVLQILNLQSESWKNGGGQNESETFCTHQWQGAFSARSSSTPVAWALLCCPHLNKPLHAGFRSFCFHHHRKIKYSLATCRLSSFFTILHAAGSGIQSFWSFCPS